MAITIRSGAQGTGIMLGVQTAYGKPIAARNKMIPRLFPVSALSLEMQADVIESSLISAFGPDGEDTVGQIWVEGSFTSEIRENDFPIFLSGVLNHTDISSTLLDSGDGANAYIAKAESSRLPSGTIELSKAVPNWPSRLELKLGRSPTIADSATMKVVGERRIGSIDAYDLTSQEETVKLTGTGGKTKMFFSKITSVKVAGVSGNGTATFLFKPETYKTDTEFDKTSAIFPGWTAMLVRGGVPDVIHDVVPTAVAISAGSDGISTEVTCFGTKLERFRSIDKKGMVALEKADTDYFKNVASSAFQGWGGALRFGDALIKCSTLDIQINRNYEPDAGFDGSRHRRGVTQTANRQVTFNPTTFYRVGDDFANKFTGGEFKDKFIDFHEQFKNQAKLPLIFRMISYDTDGRQSQIDIECPKSQIISPPQYPVTGQGQIESTLSFKALPKNDNTDDKNTELKISIWSGKAYPTVD